MTLTQWKLRPSEEAHLFNPAICGLLICEFVKEFSKAKSQPSPFVLPFCALPIALHRKTRASLPSSTLTSLYSWRERNPDVLIGFAQRAQHLRPVIQESIRFSIDRNALQISDIGDLETGTKKISASKAFEQSVTQDARDCIASAKMLGRWFAKAGATATILSAWGIKP